MRKYQCYICSSHSYNHNLISGPSPNCQFSTRVGTTLVATSIMDTWVPSSREKFSRFITYITCGTCEIYRNILAMIIIWMAIGAMSCTHSYVYHYSTHNRKEQVYLLCQSSLVLWVLPSQCSQLVDTYPPHVQKHIIWDQGNLPNLLMRAIYLK